MAKKYDLAVKTGSYTDSSGQEKGRYENIGVIMEGRDGGEYMMLKRTFNPAGVPVQDGRDSILVSMFKPKGDTSEHQTTKANGYQPQGEAPAIDDEISF